MCSMELEDSYFPMQDLPYGTVIEVIKRMDTAAFFAIQRTSKWLYRAVEANRHKFIKNVNNEDFTLQYQHIKDLDLPALKDYFLGDKRHFCYHMISIRSFRDNANELRRVLSIFKNARIYADIINVDTSAIVPEIFDYFKPKNYSFNLCKKMLPVATETYPTGPFGLIIGRAVNPKAFEDCLLALADKSERFDLTALNVDLKIEPLKMYMATLARLRSRQAFSLSMTRPLPVDGFNSPDENFYKFAFNTRGKEGKLLTLIIYNNQGEKAAGCYYSDNLHNRVEFFCAHVVSFLEFETKILGTFAKKATLLKYDRNRIIFAMSSTLIIFLWLLDLSLAYECGYTSYYGGLYCHHRPAIFYTGGAVLVCLILLAVFCCFCGFCTSAVDEPVYVAHRCQHPREVACCGQPTDIIVMPSTCSGHPSMTTMSYTTPSYVSTRTV